MQWTDIQRNPARSTLRQFAALWIVFFGLLAAYHGLYRNRPVLGFVLAFGGLVPGCLGLIAPAMIRPIYVGWMILAYPLGWAISHLMLLVMFFGVITPLAIAMRIRGRDPLRRKAMPGQQSYWLPKNMPADPRRYFRQY
ncbi:MAG: SxtJ family membrane protein [Verrucomicrobiae bacterium]|nr:SxtJ family membrane protein [Verrucomicrobiae bacterium]